MSKFTTTIILLFMLSLFTFAAVATKDIAWIIGCILFAILALLIIIQQFSKSNRMPWAEIIAVYVCTILLIVVGTLLVININDRVHSKSTIATIARIEHNNDADDDDPETCDAYVEYTVRGKSYTSKYETSSMMCNKNIGKRVKIYYRVDNPKKITTTRNLVFLALGSIIAALGSIFSIKKLVGKVRKSTT